MSTTRELVEPSHILFGSDTPFLPEPLVDASIRGLADYEPFDAAARAAIERGSALSLFPPLRAPAAA
jgi:6-methylsalicylate decarboxylase